MEREFIDHAGIVNRNVFWPFMYEESRQIVDPRQIFKFPERDGKRRESVVWRKYAPSLNDVYRIGLEKEEEHNSKPGVRSLHRYTGTIEALVQGIRAISYGGRFCLDVIHEPFNAAIYHAEIGICGADEASVRQISKNDRLYLIDELFQVFSELVPRPD